MRALLTPDFARKMGIVLLRPGPELMPLFSRGRVLVEHEPADMADLPTGLVPPVRQPLTEDPYLLRFFLDERVIQAAGGISALEAWLFMNGNTCQWGEGDYHHHEITTRREAEGALRLCWHCDTQFRDQSFKALTDIARKNVVEWVVDKARAALHFDESHTLTLPELCWWAVRQRVFEAFPEPMAEQALGWQVEPIKSVYRECDLMPSVPATSVIEEHVKPVLTLAVDPETPESFMLRPKRRRWVNQKFTRWAKSQPCECCRKPADDPHHIIGHGQGGMATKAHDLFVIPLCRAHHDELHADTVAFEEKYGSQLALWFRFIDRALATGILA
ncbi:DUF968 domain-containing protein [Mangrovibacter plantisponsor]|uniref:Uncharacterized protein DUF968 n=1 Tax=Mangrovibacter plantisponsor TaxID=451513 RepID=A0A317PGI0_9ENTR|nr:DUF968 domain-containing protein [Mangrovibacter plantisponsor]PWV99557.1 uncharacterized protein DUF968 [Mangrovibacter plantisponsor]